MQNELHLKNLVRHMKKQSFWIEFTADRSVKIEEGQTILDASLANGIPHYHACGGLGKCTTCRVLVTDGKENLSAYSERERILRETVPIPANVRLACQTYVTASPVSLHRMIRDEADIEMYIDNKEADLQNIGDETELALFFLDIRNFTPFMERYLAFDVIHVMRRLFSLFKNCIERSNGQIIETAGDGFYAVFGMGTNIKSACVDAYQAGKNILKELEHFNDRYLQRHFAHYFQVGIGLHAGRVIVGNIGIGVNNNLTVMGLPVNIASRIQAATKQLNNSFLISEIVKQHIDTQDFVAKNSLQLKGIKEAFVVYLCGQPYVSKTETTTA